MKMKNLLMTAIAIFGLTTITMAQVPSYVPTNGLVGWYPFNGNANDESGNGNNGTVNGATLTTDRFGNTNRAYSLDGASNYISALNPLGNLTTDFTISCFAYINTWSGGLFLHVGIDQNPNPRNGFGYGYGGTQAVNSGQNYLGLVSNVAWYISGYQFSNLTQWYHAIVVRSGDTLNYFVDGINVGTSTISAIQLPSNAMFFGGGSTIWALFNGKLDDIGIWNRALSQAEITAVNNNVGINEFTQDNLFSVYPNPAKSQINVKADATLLGSVYTVYDNTGKVVLSGKINSENTVIELVNLSGGVYLLSVGENMKQTFKVIKE